MGCDNFCWLEVILINCGPCKSNFTPINWRAYSFLVKTYFVIKFKNYLRITSMVFLLFINDYLVTLLKVQTISFFRVSNLREGKCLLGYNVVAKNRWPLKHHHFRKQSKKKLNLSIERKLKYIMPRNLRQNKMPNSMIVIFIQLENSWIFFVF